MKKTLILALGLFLIVGVISPQSLQAVTATLDESTWEHFEWAGISEATPSFDLTVTNPEGAVLRVTDIANAGDEFFIFIQGLGVFFSSDVANTGEFITLDPDDAWNDSRLSHLYVYLSTGTYHVQEFTIQLAQGFSAGGAEIRFDPVPEPSTLLLLGAGLIGLVAFRKRFQKA